MANNTDLGKYFGKCKSSFISQNFTKSLFIAFSDIMYYFSIEWLVTSTNTRPDNFNMHPAKNTVRIKNTRASVNTTKTNQPQ